MVDPKRVEILKKWVAGESIHNVEENECVPDFSCCVPKISTHPDVKKKFLEAYLKEDFKVMFGLMSEFLDFMYSVLKDEGKK